MKNNDIIITSSWYLNNDKDKKNSHIYMFYLDDDLNKKENKKTNKKEELKEKRNKKHSKE